MKLKALAKKIKTEKETNKRKKNNKLYQSNKKAFFNTLQTPNEKSTTISKPPSKEEITTFWGNLWKSKGTHNTKATWLEEEKKETISIENDNWTDFTTAQLTTATKKLANWKSPGIDQVQNFWIKYLTALHPTLIKNANKIINKPKTAPQWLTTATTTLIHKSGPTNNAKNYRPITCLPTYYKTITLMLTDKIYTHLTSKKLLPPEQKGIMRNARGCKDQLIIVFGRFIHRYPFIATIFWKFVGTK